MTSIQKFLTVLIEPHQDLENAGRQALLLRFIDTAEGVQLDAIGEVVGQARDGATDNTYRRVVRARISANKSPGRIEDVLTVARLVIADPTVPLVLDNQGIAALVLRIGSPITTAVRDLLISLLRVTVVGGVRIILEYSTLASAGWFRWDTGPGWDTGSFLDALD